VALLLLAVLALGVPLISQALNLVDVFAFPLGYFMVAQGSLIGLVLVGIASARWQDRRRRATDS
jgi:putative solute:sodium symporter small subunit